MSVIFRSVAKWGSWPRVDGFEPTTFMSKRRKLIRLANGIKARVVELNEGASANIGAINAITTAVCPDIFESNHSANLIEAFQSIYTVSDEHTRSLHCPDHSLAWTVSICLYEFPLYCSKPFIQGWNSRGPLLAHSMKNKWYDDTHFLVPKVYLGNISLPVLFPPLTYSLCSAIAFPFQMILVIFSAMNWHNFGSETNGFLVWCYFRCAWNSVAPFDLKQVQRTEVHFTCG